MDLCDVNPGELVGRYELAEALKMAPQAVSGCCTNDMQPSLEGPFEVSRYETQEESGIFHRSNYHSKRTFIGLILK